MAATKPWEPVLLHVKHLSRYAKKLTVGNVQLLLIAASLFMCLVFLLRQCWRRRSREARGPKKLKVNCWFCNADSDILASRKNGWYCKTCDQYNGFTDAGDYNKEISEMFASSEEKTSEDFRVKRRDDYDADSFISGPKLCDSCNRMQVLKVRQIAAFIPTNEASFSYEISEYKHQLEKRYKLCHNCSTMLQHYLDYQDMQLEQTYGTFDLVVNKEKSDDDVQHVAKTIEGKQSMKQKKRRKWSMFSFLWPSSFLSLISLASAWILLISKITGIFVNSADQCVCIGSAVRVLTWILNPLSNRKFMLLILWLSLLCLIAMNSLLKYDLTLWFRIVIFISESWSHIWSLFHMVIKITWRGFLGIIQKKSDMVQSNKHLKKNSPKTSPSEKPKKVAKNKRISVSNKKTHQDNINGRISTMSLGLTDSEDETNQVRRAKHVGGSRSWYASASKFVTEEESMQKTIVNKNGNQQKFLLHPPRLQYPLLVRPEPTAHQVPEERELKASIQKSDASASMLRQRNIQFSDNEAEETEGENEIIKEEKLKQDKHSSGRKNHFFMQTVKLLLKVVLFGIIISSIILNVYFFKKGATLPFRA